MDDKFVPEGSPFKSVVRSNVQFLGNTTIPGLSGFFQFGWASGYCGLLGEEGVKF